VRDSLCRFLGRRIFSAGIWADRLQDSAGIAKCVKQVDAGPDLDVDVGRSSAM